MKNDVLTVSLGERLKGNSSLTAAEFAEQMARQMAEKDAKPGPKFQTARIVSTPALPLDGEYLVTTTMGTRSFPTIAEASAFFQTAAAGDVQARIWKALKAKVTVTFEDAGELEPAPRRPSSPRPPRRKAKPPNPLALRKSPTLGRRRACPKGCGKLCYPSGLSKHVRWCDGQGGTRVPDDLTPAEMRSIRQAGKIGKVAQDKKPCRACGRKFELRGLRRHEEFCVGVTPNR